MRVNIRNMFNTMCGIGAGIGFATNAFNDKSLVMGVLYAAGITVAVVRSALERSTIGRDNEAIYKPTCIISTLRK